MWPPAYICQAQHTTSSAVALEDCYWFENPNITTVYMLEASKLSGSHTSRNSKQSHAIFEIYQGRKSSHIQENPDMQQL